MQTKQKNNELEIQDQQFEKNNNTSLDNDLESIFVSLGQTQLFNTFNEFKQKDEFKKILNKNSLKIKQNINDISNNWYKKYTIKQRNMFKTILQNQINKDENKAIADNALKQIIEAKNFIESQFNNLNIKSKKRQNNLIVASCFCGIGFFLLKKRKQNKQIINDFNNMLIEKNDLINEQWRIKTDAIKKLFSNFSKTKIINEVFKESGIFIQDYASVPDLHSALKTVIANAIGFTDVFALNIGKKVVYFTNYCKEWFETITTYGSIVVPYTNVEKYTDQNSNCVTENVSKTQKIMAQHKEITPRRELDSLSIMKLKESSHQEKEFSWTLKFNKINKIKNLDHLKNETIAKNEIQKIQNVLNLENIKFNQCFELNADIITGSVSDEQIISTWFTIGTQENFVKFKDYCDEINNDLIYFFIIRKSLDYLIVYRDHPLPIKWLTNTNFCKDIKYDQLSSVQDNINLLCSKFDQEINQFFMSYVNIYLSFTKILNDIINDQSFKNYSLLNNKMINPFEVDGSYLISLGVRNNVLFSTNPKKALIDNYIEESTNVFDNFIETIVNITNYYISNEIDYVSVSSLYCNTLNSIIPVPYEKYNPYQETAIIISINPKNIKNFETKLNKYTNYLHHLSLTFYAIYDNDRVNLFFNNIDKKSIQYQELFLYAEKQFNKDDN